jgi:WD40 repeat protein
MSIFFSFIGLLLLLGSLAVPNSQQTSNPILRHDAMILGAAFNHDGSRILSWSADGTARIWDADNGHQLHIFDMRDAQARLTQKQGMFAVGAAIASWSPDEKRVLVTYTPSGHIANSLVTVWDAQSGKTLAAYPQEGYANAEFNQDGSELLVWKSICSRLDPASPAAQCTRSFHILNALTGQETHSITLAAESYEKSLWIEQQAKLITWRQTTNEACCTHEGLVEVWDGVTGRVMRTFLYHHEEGYDDAPELNNAQKQLFTVQDNTITVFDVLTGKVVSTVAEESLVQDVYWTDAHTLVLVSGMPEKLSISTWNVLSGKRVSEQSAFTAYRFWMSPNNRYLLIGFTDTHLAVYDVLAGKIINQVKPTIPDPQSSGLYIETTWNFAGDQFLTAWVDSTNYEFNYVGEATLWEASSGEPVSKFPAGKVLAWSPDGKKIVFYDDQDYTMEMFDTRTGKCLVPTTVG